MTESPTIWVHGHHPFTASQISEIERKVLSLSLEDRRAFTDMANVFPERFEVQHLTLFKMKICLVFSSNILDKRFRSLRFPY
jgi:hypothetical protein